MAIIWCGGEDIDFPNGATVINDNASYNRRSSYSRVSIYRNSGIMKSSIFSCGEITSGWLSFYYSGTTPPYYMGGFGKSGTNNCILTGLNDTGKILLYKYDGVTFTLLATGVNTNADLCKVDLYFSNYTFSSNVKVYVNGILEIDYTGDITFSGVTGFDSVFSRNTASCPLSEFIVADEDTRSMSLVTLYPNAAGDTNDWAGAYTDIDETIQSDADIIYDATQNHDFQCGLSDTPAGTFVVKAVKEIVRATKGASGPSHIQLGIKSGGTIDVAAEQDLDAVFTSVERLMQQNPVTSNNFTTSELDALQLNLRTGS